MLASLLPMFCPSSFSAGLRLPTVPRSMLFFRCLQGSNLTNYHDTCDFVSVLSSPSAQIHGKSKRFKVEKCPSMLESLEVSLNSRQLWEPGRRKLRNSAFPRHLPVLATMRPLLPRPQTHTCWILRSTRNFEVLATAEILTTLSVSCQ